MKTSFMTEMTHRGSGTVMSSVSIPKVAPIHMSSAYVFKDSSECSDVCFEKTEGYLYGSYGNPTTDSLIDIIKAAEGGDDAIVFSTGMAAISLAIMSQIKAGDHIIANSVIYGNSFKFLKGELENRFGVEVSLVDMKNDSLEKHFRKETKLVYIETISNPMMAVLDIKEIADIAHEYGAKLIIDNTFATPIVCQPLKHGADIVVHSGTKFLNGHSDIMAGVVVSNKEEIKKIMDLSYTFGPIISPFDAWLLTRSMRTLELRVNKHSSNAMQLAQYLEKNNKFGKVYYPGLESFEDNAVAKKIFNNENFGGMLAVDLGSYSNIVKFNEKSKMIKIVPSLGTFTTSVCDTTITHCGMTAQERREMGIPEGLLRISVGLENIEDIIQEFEDVLKEV